ncbi:hypothetical protein Gobs01_03542 [Geodermatophilus obscurus DSM 43160]|uniref:HTH-like domain-containing protein n=1 Tax=Geodermatophilus obscurus (strain ATCC 25078 / DSM 43160 / JCM 3152 / CCUG 61914 / KCC A-0152 / KCTC 9177 / NBRC 13315 / NRRL B-3577 / G-20) TaxID=526225 RepID=D2S8J2_GEOOG|nr:hypothetical protein Gobs_2961 [Geodermatophilus obscurus DSM 43160]
MSSDERAELARLRRRVAESELEKEILVKGRGLLRALDGAVNRGAVFGFVAAEKTTYGVRRLRRVLGVSSTAFYDCHARGGDPTTAELEEAYAIHAAREAWCEHRRVYDARRRTAEIRHRGHAWNRKRVARLMPVGGMEGVHCRRRGKDGRRTTSTATAAHLVERDFTAGAPDRLWVADIPYLCTWEGFPHLAVLDACSRRVVGWAMADHLRTELVLDAVGIALFARKSKLPRESLGYRLPPRQGPGHSVAGPRAARERRPASGDRGGRDLGRARVTGRGGSGRGGGSGRAAGSWARGHGAHAQLVLQPHVRFGCPSCTEAAAGSGCPRAARGSPKDTARVGPASTAQAGDGGGGSRGGTPDDR